MPLPCALNTSTFGGKRRGRWSSELLGIASCDVRTSSNSQGILKHFTKCCDFPQTALGCYRCKSYCDIGQYSLLTTRRLFSKSSPDKKKSNTCFLVINPSVFCGAFSICLFDIICSTVQTFGPVTQRSFLQQLGIDMWMKVSTAVVCLRRANCLFFRVPLNKLIIWLVKRGLIMVMHMRHEL